MGSPFTQLPLIESETLTLRRIVESDLDALYEIYRNDNVFAFIPGGVKKSKETVRNMIGHFERDFRNKKTATLGICLAEKPDELIGTAEIFDFDPKVNMATIGYRLNEAYWGRGIATQTVRALTNYLFSTVGLNRIAAYVMPQNVASQRVLEKNGFVREGLLRQANFWTGKGVVDLVVFSRLRADTLA
ncbi:MAG: GNAT family protein [Clostridiaceae bacterium]